MSFGKLLVCALSTIVFLGISLPSRGRELPLPPLRPASPTAKDEAKILPTDKPMDHRQTNRALLKREAEKNGLPLDVADAVVTIESGYDPSVIGSVGEIGLMQVRPGTAAMLGFRGEISELAKPEINLHYGIAYLAAAWRLAKGDLCRALMKYRAGHGEEQMSALSVSYCNRARAHLASIGSPLAAGYSGPIASVEPMPRSHRSFSAPKIRTAAVSRAFWAAHDARVRAISAKIEAKWRRMAAR